MRIVGHTRPQITKKRDHMEKLNSEVIEICPITGSEIAPVEFSRRYVVKIYLIKAIRPQHPLDKYQKMGVKNMTEAQINSAYEIIKGLKCKIV